MSRLSELWLLVYFDYTKGETQRWCKLKREEGYNNNTIENTEWYTASVRGSLAESKYSTHCNNASLLTSHLINVNWDTNTEVREWKFGGVKDVWNESVNKLTKLP